MKTEKTAKSKSAKRPAPSVVDRVVSGIVNSVISGEIRPGSRLPTEPELCSHYNAGRNSVREAIKKLEAYGVVYIRRADGTYISASYNQKMLDPMLYSIILSESSWSDFVELRRVIEIGTLHVVLEREPDKELLRRLRSTVSAMRRELKNETPSAEKVLSLDTRFHCLITSATRNPQLSTINEYVTRLTIPSRLVTVKKVIEEGETENFLQLHHQFIDVLDRRDIARIEQVISDHYVYWKNT